METLISTQLKLKNLGIDGFGKLRSAKKLLKANQIELDIKDTSNVLNNILNYALVLKNFENAKDLISIIFEFHQSDGPKSDNSGVIYQNLTKDDYQAIIKLKNDLDQNENVDFVVNFLEKDFLSKIEEISFEIEDDTLATTCFELLQSFSGDKVETVEQDQEVSTSQPKAEQEMVKFKGKHYPRFNEDGKEFYGLSRGGANYR